jgi:putative flippase GtrA
MHPSTQPSIIPKPTTLTTWQRLTLLYPQVRGFILAGLIGTLIDYSFYYVYDQWFPPLFSKGLAFSSATVFVYFMNKFWTFKQPLHSKRELWAFFGLYTVSMLVNTTVNTLCLQGLPNLYQQLQHTQFISTGSTYQLILVSLSHPRSIKVLAFLMATSTSTIINFIGQKFWVFELKRKQLAKHMTNSTK